MTSMSSLANHLLIAMPGCVDPRFQKTVVYICENHPDGSVGLIINKPTEYKLDLIFKQLQLEPIQVELGNQPLMWGGPFQGERGFVVHESSSKIWNSSLKLPNNMTITTSNDIIRDKASGAGPEQSLVILGYSAWNAGQLEQEIQDNIWLICPCTEALIGELLFKVPFDKRWDFAALSMGVHMNQLSPDAGHA